MFYLTTSARDHTFLVKSNHDCCNNSCHRLVFLYLHPRHLFFRRRFEIQYNRLHQRMVLPVFCDKQIYELEGSELPSPATHFAGISSSATQCSIIIDSSMSTSVTSATGAAHAESMSAGQRYNAGIAPDNMLSPDLSCGSLHRINDAQKMQRKKFELNSKFDIASCFTKRNRQNSVGREHDLVMKNIYRMNIPWLRRLPRLNQPVKVCIYKRTERAAEVTVRVTQAEYINEMNYEME